MNKRFSRQELLIGEDAQQKLASSKLAVVGLGALGTVASDLLIRAGIGTLTLIDRDSIEESNLQRQILFNEKDIGEAKAEVAAKKLKEVNSKASINCHVTDINYKNVDLLSGHDLILDCTDNLYTRFLINEFTKKNNIPWIYAAAVRDHGNVMVINKETPCFRCSFKEAKGLDTCDTAGVLNTATSLIASLQVNEAIKVLTKGYPEQNLIHMDLENLEISLIKTSPDKECPVCNGNFEYLDGKKEPELASLQCSNLYQFQVEDLKTKEIKSKLEKIGEVKGNEDYIFFKNLSIFKNGKILVRAKDQDHAKAEFAKYIGESV